MDSTAAIRQMELAVAETRAGQYLRALEKFEAGFAESAAVLGQANARRLRSYYGLCVAMVWGRTTQPLAWCRAALEDGGDHPDLFHNLGLVLLRSRRREEAVEALRAGLRLDPDHAGLLATFERLTPRRKPLFSFLARRHPLNRFGGLIRARVLGG
jgi:tetratricopeptide (TPR) repeat protein